MNWGMLQFEVYPLNFHELDHRTATDWARKEIAGAPIHREYVGEGDEELHLRGRVFPYRLGGLGELEIMEQMRRDGEAHLITRSDGWRLGWYVMERLVRSHLFINPNAVGRQINFEAQFARVPVPDGVGYFGLWFRQVE